MAYTPEQRRAMMEDDTTVYTLDQFASALKLDGDAEGAPKNFNEAVDEFVTLFSRHRSQQSAEAQALLTTLTFSAWMAFYAEFAKMVDMRELVKRLTGSADAVQIATVDDPVTPGYVRITDLPALVEAMQGNPTKH